MDVVSAFWFVAASYVCLVEERKSIVAEFFIANNGTKWFGVHIPREDGRDTLLHMITIRAAAEASFVGANVVCRMDIVLSKRPLTGG